MIRQCRSFLTEFKRDSAARVLDLGYMVSKARISLDVGVSALRR